MSLAIVGGTLIDGSGREPIQNGVVVVEAGRITAAGPADKVELPADATRIDTGGGTILPGFVDCHLHCSYRARDYAQHLKNPSTYNVFRSGQLLRETLECGVTTARDTGGADAGFRQAIAEGIVAGPRLQVAIAMISQSGGHGDCFVPAGFRVPKREDHKAIIAHVHEETHPLARAALDPRTWYFTDADRDDERVR